MSPRTTARVGPACIALHRPTGRESSRKIGTCRKNTVKEARPEVTSGFDAARPRTRVAPHKRTKAGPEIRHTIEIDAGKKPSLSRVAKYKTSGRAGCSAT